MSVARLLAAVWACGVVGVVDGQNVYESYSVSCAFKDEGCNTILEHGFPADYTKTTGDNVNGFILSTTVNYHSPNCIKYSFNASCQQLRELGQALAVQGQKCYFEGPTNIGQNIYTDLTQCTDVTTSTTTTTTTTLTTTTTGSNDTSDDFPVWAIVLLSVGVPLACVLAVMGYRKFLVKQATAATATLTNDIL